MRKPRYIIVPGLSRGHLSADTRKSPYRGCFSSGLLPLHGVTKMRLEAAVTDLRFCSGRFSYWLVDHGHDHDWRGGRQGRDAWDVIFICWFQCLVKDVIVYLFNGRWSALVSEDQHEDSHGDEDGEYQYRMHGTTIVGF
jgi:hypothetical protein